jgi:hypothetical protein
MFSVTESWSNSIALSNQDFFSFDSLQELIEESKTITVEYPAVQLYEILSGKNVQDLTTGYG